MTLPSIEELAGLCAALYLIALAGDAAMAYLRKSA